MSKTLQYLKKILYNGRWVFDRKSIFNPRLHCSKSRENGIIFYGIVVELLFIESWVLKFCHIALLKSATLANGYVFLLWPASFFKRKMQFPWERGRRIYAKSWYFKHSIRNNQIGELNGQMFKWGIFKQLSWLRDTYDWQLKNFFKVHGFFSALREAFAFMKKKKEKKKKKKEKFMSGCHAFSVTWPEGLFIVTKWNSPLNVIFRSKTKTTKLIVPWF